MYWKWQEIGIGGLNEIVKGISELWWYFSIRKKEHNSSLHFQTSPYIFYKYIFYLFVCICLLVCTYVCRCPGKPEECCIPWSWATEGCELHDVGAGNRTQICWMNSRCSSLLSPPSGPLFMAYVHMQHAYSHTQKAYKYSVFFLGLQAEAKWSRGN